MLRSSSPRISYNRQPQNWKPTAFGMSFCLLVMILAAQLLVDGVKAEAHVRQLVRGEELREILSAPNPANEAGSYQVVSTTAGVNAVNFKLTAPGSSSSIILFPGDQSLDHGTVGQRYNLTFTADGGEAPYTFNFSGGELPNGLTLKKDGLLSGTPTFFGNFIFLITATDARGGDVARTYTMEIAPPLPSTLPHGTIGIPYDQTLKANGGTPSNTFMLFGGSLPVGLTLRTDGRLYGIPDNPGKYAFNVLVTDAIRFKSFTSYLLTITRPADAGSGIDLDFGGWAQVSNPNASAGSDSPRSMNRVNAPFDFDGDGQTDLSIWRLRERDWAIINSRDGSLSRVLWSEEFDALRDIIVNGDFDGDGKADPAVFRITDGQWRIVKSSTGVSINFNFGGMIPDFLTNRGTYANRSSDIAGVIPVPADYDGDGKTDIALFSDANGGWRIRRSSDEEVITSIWGMTGDIPVPADYDGDSKADLAVFRPSNGAWYVLRSSDQEVMVKFWGAATDIPVQADYDGDGKVDFSVWRESDKTWYTIHSADNSEHAVYWDKANKGDVPVPGKYDNDNKADQAIWHDNNGEWHVKPSNGSPDKDHLHGSSGDKPVPGKLKNQNRPS